MQILYYTLGKFKFCTEGQKGQLMTFKQMASIYLASWKKKRKKSRYFKDNRA